MKHFKMKPALILIDLQNDFLESRTLSPSAGVLISRVSVLVEGVITRARECSSAVFQPHASASKELQGKFLKEARAGVLKLNSATADAGLESPFGGWKASGTGPPEHGPGNREFYTRAQSVYVDE
jgi:hypothetical protein